MGFVQPSPPPFDLEEWRAQPYLTRLRMNCQDWAVNGFAPPDAVYLLYAIKLVLYLFLAAGAYLLVSNGSHGLLSRTAIVVFLALWAALGLRDKVPFLAARPEIYGFFLIVSLFHGLDVLVGWQFVMFFIWWGAASSKLNRHFPYVIAVMVSNTPWNRSRKAKAKLYRDYPNDLRPGRPAAIGAHLGTA